jgi:hypothetical protein
MTYIWNRVEKVPKDKMPHVVEQCFKEWTKKQYKHFGKLTEEEKNRVNFNVAKQMGRMEYNLKQLGYK